MAWHGLREAEDAFEGWAAQAWQSSLAIAGVTFYHAWLGLQAVNLGAGGGQAVQHILFWPSGLVIKA